MTAEADERHPRREQELSDSSGAESTGPQRAAAGPAPAEVQDRPKQGRRERQDEVSGEAGLETRDYKQDVAAEPMAGRQPTGSQAQDRSALIGEQASARYRQRWESIQATFVDEPRRAVEEADRLVGEVVDHLTRTFSQARQGLEGQWARGDKASTEDLRVALQRYRDFFQGLLKR